MAQRIQLAHGVLDLGHAVFQPAPDPPVALTAREVALLRYLG